MPGIYGKVESERPRRRELVAERTSTNIRNDLKHEPPQAKHSEERPELPRGESVRAIPLHIWSFARLESCRKHRFG